MGDEAADVCWGQVTQASNAIPSLDCVPWVMVRHGKSFEQQRDRGRCTCQKYCSGADLGDGLAIWPEGWFDDPGGRSKSGQRFSRQEGPELGTKWTWVGILPQAQDSGASWEQAMAVMPPPLLVPTDNLHHNYLHLNVNSPKHHAATLGMDQGGAAGRAGLLPFPPLY